MPFLGVDPSLTGFAYSHLCGEKPYAFGIRTKPKDFDSFPARLDFITMGFRRFLSDHGGSLTLAAIEGFSFGSARSGMTQVMITAVGMMARVELWRAGVPFVEVPPSTLKKWISGRGNAEKNLMLREVYKRWGFDAETDDDADAFALVKLAEAMCSGAVDGTKADRLHWEQIKKACTRIEGKHGSLVCTPG